MAELLEVIGDGHYATPVTEEEQIRDDNGFTHPNLHRRVNPVDMESCEYQHRDYLLDIYGFNSYRTMIQYTHSEDEQYTNDEIP